MYEKIIFGTRQIGGNPSYHPCEEKIAKNVLEIAYQKGIRTFDTAPIYGFGQSEKFLWDTFSHVRKDIQIITKFWFSWWNDNKTFFDFSFQGITSQLEQSLRRLQTDYIDIYLLHIPEPDISAKNIIDTLKILKKQWLIRHFWVCNMYQKQLQDFILEGGDNLEYIQDFYNLIEKKAERLIFPYKTHHKFLAYSPLYRWLLTSKTMEQMLKQDENAINRLIKNNSLPHIYKQKKLLEAVAHKKWIPLEKLAIDFLKHNPNISSIVFWTKSSEHLLQFLENFWD